MIRSFARKRWRKCDRTRTDGHKRNAQEMARTDYRDTVAGRMPDNIRAHVQPHYLSLSDAPVITVPVGLTVQLVRFNMRLQSRPTGPHLAEILPKRSTNGDSATMKTCSECGREYDDLTPEDLEDMASGQGCPSDDCPGWPSAIDQSNDWLTRAQRVIHKHYRLTRPVTQAEVNAELANLFRRYKAKSLDDAQERLLAALEVADVVQS